MKFHWEISFRKYILLPLSCLYILISLLVLKSHALLRRVSTVLTQWLENLKKTALQWRVQPHSKLVNNAGFKINHLCSSIKKMKFEQTLKYSWSICWISLLRYRVARYLPTWSVRSNWEIDWLWIFDNLPQKTSLMLNSVQAKLEDITFVNTELARSICKSECFASPGTQQGKGWRIVPDLARIPSQSFIELHNMNAS